MAEQDGCHPQDNIQNMNSTTFETTDFETYSNGRKENCINVTTYFITVSDITAYPHNNKFYTQVYVLSKYIRVYLLPVPNYRPQNYRIMTRSLIYFSMLFKWTA